MCFKSRGFHKNFQRQQVPIIAQVDNQRKLKVTNNRHVLTEILKLIHLLGKQNIAIRGKTDERSNFIVFLKALAEKDAILAEHLNSIKARKEAEKAVEYCKTTITALRAWSFQEEEKQKKKATKQMQ